MKGKVTESIYDGQRLIIPLRDVEYLEKIVAVPDVRANEGFGDGIPFQLLGIKVFMKGSSDDLTIRQPEAQAFLSAWLRYRFELESDTLACLEPIAEDAVNELEVMAKGLLAISQKMETIEPSLAELNAWQQEYNDALVVANAVHVRKDCI